MIRIAEDFSKYPMGRYFPKDGQFAGERFRNEFLKPSLEAVTRSGSKEQVTVVLDGVRTFGSSFLEEAFGGLVREENYTAEQLRKILRISYSQPELSFYAEAIMDYITKARHKHSA